MMQHSYRFWPEWLTMSPKRGYALWAASYESENNLMQTLDEQLVQTLLQHIDLQGGKILDFGCGTGRHWSFLKSQHPESIIGCDISPEMLRELEKKYPNAITFLLKKDKQPQLDFLPDHTIDLIFSTLTIGHLPDLATVVQEWSKKSKAGGYLCFTGNHPDALQSGITRTFSFRNRRFHIRNYVHDFSTIKAVLNKAGWVLKTHQSTVVDENCLPFFERANAMKSYEKVKGMPIIYGMLWQKR